ncbi:MAG: PAS domain S-box protein, partial [Proteobacteria bacterium]|nr:PAS domain S-box protein [Pseudomonadota bacterium]
SYEGTIALFKNYDLFLESVNLTGRPYIEISDYSRITNIPSKRTRLKVLHLLMEKVESNCLIGHFIYNVPKHIRWMYNIGTKLKQPGIPMMALDTYEEAVQASLQLLKDAPAKAKPISFLRKIIQRIRTRTRLEHYSDEILNYMGSINWDEQGTRFENIPDSHPFKAVFEALAVIKTDIDQTYNERQEIEKKYKGLFHHISDPIIVFDQETHHIIDCNRAFLTIYGYSKDELNAMTPHNLHPEEDLEKVKKNIGNPNRLSPNRYTHITKSGKKIDVEIRTDGTEYQGRPAWISNIRDITGRNKLEKELVKHRDELEKLVEERTRELEQEIAERKQTETKFKTLFESSSDAVVLLDQKGILDCNHAALKIFECRTKEEFCALHPADLSPKIQPGGQLSMDLADQKIKDASTKGSQNFEWTHQKTKTKKIFPADVLLTPMELNGKQVLQGVIRDITHRKQAEEKLKNSEEKYRGIIENMQDVFYRTDIDQNLTMISPSGLKLLGYDTDNNLLGENISELFYNSSDKYFQFLKALQKNRNVTNFELEIFHKDGSAIPILSSSNYYLDRHGNPLGIEGILSNISERKKTEEQLKKAMVEAKEATKTKSEFLANMSHEIRTPMNGIMGMVELILDTELDDTQKKLATTITSEAESLLAIINSILDFSKIEAGKLELDTIPFNLRFLFEDLSSTFAITAQKKDLEFISFLPPDAPEMLMGDPGRLRQVLINLVGNALKFTHKGEIFIWADSFKDLGKAVKLRFCVKDTGIGIPKASLNKIFDSFSQADGSTTRRYGGTGLGTTISKQIVTMMGGKIGVKSQPFSGSTFWFTAVFKKDASLIEENQPAGPADLNRLSVLVVDDNKNNRFVFCEHLKSWGCIPVEAESGPKALSILKKSLSSNKVFDMILSDFQMPRMNGFQLVKEIKKEAALKNIPIIILTSMGMIGDNKICKELGIQGYLSKPIKRNDLNAAIVSILNKDMINEKTLESLPLTKHTISETKRRKLQILLAEDYPTNQLIAIKHLTASGFQVILAENGQQAVDFFKKRQFDLILMDIQMPLVDGYEATRLIREQEKIKTQILLQNNPGETPTIKRTPIIAMTAHAIKGYKKKCIAADMDDYITKPFAKKDLIALVEKWTIQNKKTVIKPEVKETEFSSSPSRNENDPAAPLDLEKALDEFENDKEFFMEVLNGFIHNVESQIPKVEQAIEKQDFSTIQKEAHAIKGGSANLTAMAISKAAHALEASSKSNDTNLSSALLENLKKEFIHLKTYATHL